jgi:hypothetical protein
MIKPVNFLGGPIVIGLLGGSGFLLFFQGGPTKQYPLELTFLYLWALLVLYILWMSRWVNGTAKEMVLPLLLCLVAAFTTRLEIGFLVIAAVCLGWIRSRIYFGFSLLKTLLIEGFYLAGTMALIGFLASNSRLAWPLGIWMFFLLQSLFHLWVGKEKIRPVSKMQKDPFEDACRAAERILGDPSGPFDDQAS